MIADKVNAGCKSKKSMAKTGHIATVLVLATVYLTGARGSAAEVTARPTTSPLRDTYRRR